ncbi:MAG TPA: alkaline phosphatase family protein [Terriglobales bacterium]|nr:alkaline phosphatase family protein [Terriglobales bacterium]
MADSPRFLLLFLVILVVLTTAGCGGPLEPALLPKLQAGQPAEARPELTFSVSPAAAEAGQLLTLTWTTRNATQVTIAPGLGTFPPQGTYSLIAQASQTFTATAIGPGGEVAQNITFSLTRPQRPRRSVELPNPINHVIMMFQENRSFDSYFGNMNVYRVANGLPASVDVADSNATNPAFEQNGSPIARFHMTTVCALNTSPAWNESHVQVDTDYLIMPGSQVTQSRMNGFVYTAAKYARDQSPPYFDTEGRRAMGYYTERELPYYYFMAANFAISDRWFGPVLSRSAPSRIFTYAATSNGYVYEPNVGGIKNIFQLLQENNISWKIYYTDADSQGGPIAYIRYFDAFYQANKAKVVPASQFATDAQNGTLPQVAMIESGYGNSGLDEHPLNNIQTGAAYVAGFINTLMASQSWKDSAFFLTYDESGGLYDHVPPPAAVHPDGISPIDKPSTDIEGDFTRYGMRVPNLVISPYVKPGYVSHTVIDHTAILKFIETRFNLPPLTARDSSQSNMYDFFDFSTAARLTPPTPPAQPTTAPCYYDRLP